MHVFAYHSSQVLPLSAYFTIYRNSSLITYQERKFLFDARFGSMYGISLYHYTCTCGVTFKFCEMSCSIIHVICLPQTTIAPLQRVQNAAARLVFELGPRQHVTPCLLQLHWLPVRWRIQFKLCCIMHSVFNGKCPVYLSDIVQTVSAIFAYDHPHRPTTCYHDFAPSSASAPFLTLVRLYGTDYQKTFARNLT